MFFTEDYNCQKHLKQVLSQKIVTEHEEPFNELKPLNDKF